MSVKGAVSPSAAAGRRDPPRGHRAATAARRLCWRRRSRPVGGDNDLLRQIVLGVLRHRAASRRRARARVPHPARRSSRRLCGRSSRSRSTRSAIWTGCPTMPPSTRPCGRPGERRRRCGAARQRRSAQPLLRRFRRRRDRRIRPGSPPRTPPRSRAVLPSRSFSSRAGSRDSDGDRPSRSWRRTTRRRAWTSWRTRGGPIARRSPRRSPRRASSWSRPLLSPLGLVVVPETRSARRFWPPGTSPFRTRPRRPCRCCCLPATSSSTSPRLRAESPSQRSSWAARGTSSRSTGRPRGSVACGRRGSGSGFRRCRPWRRTSSRRRFRPRASTGSFSTPRAAERERCERTRRSACG